MSKERQAIIRKKLNMREYLRELQTLIGRSVDEAELGNPSDVGEIRNIARKLDDGKAIVYEAFFADRKSRRFSSLIERITEAYPSEIYIMTEKTQYCGAILVPSLKCVNFDFDFSINQDGIVEFLAKDLGNGMYLDFYISDSGDQLLEIVISGEEWKTIIY